MLFLVFFFFNVRFLEYYVKFFELEIDKFYVFGRIYYIYFGVLFLFLISYKNMFVFCYIKSNKEIKFYFLNKIIFLVFI